MESSPKMISAPHDEAERLSANSHPKPGGGGRRCGAFSFVEILVAVAIGAAVLAAAVVCFQAIGASGNRLGSYGAVTVGNAVLTNFYGSGMTSDSVRTWFAPNYGRLANVEVMREKFAEDVQRSIAVYCLPRTGRSSIRPTNIAFDGGAYDLASFDARRLDTSEAFRQFLATAIPDSSATFLPDAFAASGSAQGKNLSIFVIIPSVDPDLASLDVHAIYEVDFAPSTSPSGTYASVRRYQGETMTDYYDALYADLPDGTAVLPDDFHVAASFQRAGSSTNTSPLRDAAGQPFYFVWWPDPASPTLPNSGTDYLSSMPGQSSYMMVVPMFPAL